jgi:hypothetical protein
VRRGFRLLLTLAALGMAAGTPVRRPAAAISRNGALSITLPADLLRSAEVTEQLTSGLTTTFTLAVSANDGHGTTKGGARIDIRLELWEEKYLVTITGPTGEESKLTLGSRPELEQWWSVYPLMVIPPRSYKSAADVQVTLRMLPFSAREQSDTRRWLSRTLSASKSAGDERDGERSADVLRIIVETSVRRRPLLERQWSVRAVRDASP